MKLKYLSIIVIFLILFPISVHAQIEFPEGYEIGEDDLGNTVFKNKFAKGKSIKVEGEEYKLEIGTELKVSPDLKKYTLIGKADLRIGSDQFLEGISNGFIKLDEDDKVIFAEFSSPNGGTYGFEYNDEFYVIDAKPGTKVIFDPLNNKITAESFLIKGDKESKIYIGNNQITGTNINIELNEKGEVKYTKVKDGSYTHNGKTYNSRGELEVYSDGTDVSNKDSAISIKGNTIQIKGPVSMTNGLSYNSLSSNTLTEYNDVLNLFDIKEGHAELSNAKHTVTVSDGSARLSFNDGYSLNEELESFRYVHTNKYGLDEYGFLDESEGNFVMSSYVNGRIKAKSIPFEQYQQLLKQPVTIESTIAGLESELDLLTEINAPLAKVSDTKTKLQIARNSLLVEEGNIDNAIEQTKFLLLDSSISETANKDYLQISLAELEIQRAIKFEEKQGQLLLGSFSDESKVDEIDLNLLNQRRSERDTAIIRLQEIRDGAIGSNNRDLYESSTFVLAEAYSKKGEHQKAASEYRKMINKVGNSNTLSEANRLLGAAELQDGNVAAALRAYEEAYKRNPSNKNTKQDLIQLRVNSLRAINTGLGVDSNQLFARFEREAGFEGIVGEGLTTIIDDPIDSLKNIASDAWKVSKSALRISIIGSGDGGQRLAIKHGDLQTELNNQQTGILALSAVANDGYDLNRFYSLSVSQRADQIQKSIEGLDRPTAVGWAEATVGLPRRNSDIALLVSRGDYFESQKYSGHTSPEFRFQTGEGYLDPKILQDTWHDILLDEINLRNVALILAPEALVTVGGRSLTVGGWATRGSGAILASSTTGSRVLNGISAIRSIPGVVSGSTRTLVELGIGIGLSEISPRYTADIVSVFAGRLGVQSIKGVTRKILLTADDRILPHFVAETSQQLKDVTSNAKRIANNLYLDSSGRQFVASVGEIDIPRSIPTKEASRRFTSNAKENNRKLYGNRGLQDISDKKVFEKDDLWIDPKTNTIIPPENRNLDLYHSLRANEDPKNIGYFDDHIDRNGKFSPGGEPASGRYSWGIDEDGRFIYFSDEYFNHRLALKDKQAFGAGEVEITNGQFDIDLVENNIPIGGKSGHYRRFGDDQYNANSIDAFKLRARESGWNSINDPAQLTTIGNSPVVASFGLDEFTEFTAIRARGIQRGMEDLVGTGSEADRLISEAFPSAKFARNRGVSEGGTATLPRPRIESPLIDDRVPRQIYRFDSNRVAYTSDVIDERNINKIFTHTFSDEIEIRGAKAVSYQDNNGKYHTRFWSTGELTEGNNIHHRDAIASLLEEEGGSLIRDGYNIRDLNSFENGFKLQESAQTISSIRVQSSFSKDVLERSQGFKFSIDSSGNIVRFDIDSSITATQISRGYRIDASELSIIIRQVHESIDPSLRGYRSIRVNSRFLNLIEGELNLPNGLRLEPVL